MVGDRRPLPAKALPGSPVPPGDGSRNTLDRPQPYCFLSQQSKRAFFHFLASTVFIREPVSKREAVKLALFYTSVTLGCSFSWTQVFLRRSAWCHGTRKASWSSPTLTSSAALTVPSRSCSPWLPALCSTSFGWDCPDLEHTCTTEEEQARGDDISTATAAGQSLVNLSHIH